MKIDVRTPKGKKLFEWNPQKKTITIVAKQHRYRVELKDDSEKRRERNVILNPQSCKMAGRIPYGKAVFFRSFL